MAEDRRSKGFFWGAVLILMGAWFLFDRMGIELPGIGQLWPVFPMLGGMASLVAYFSQKDADRGLLFPGVFGLLTGCFFFLFTFEYLYWYEMSELWPAFPSMVGVAFLVTWLVGRGKDSGLLISGLITLSVGTIGFGFTLGLMSFENVRLAGALLAVVVGAFLVFKALRQGG